MRASLVDPSRGSQGVRLASFTERWLGLPYPSRIARSSEGVRCSSRRIAKPEQVVTVVAREHAGYWSHQIGGALARGAVTQPVNRDTAAGIFLPLARVRASSPEATVAVFPSDHFVHPRGRFLETSLERLGESGADRGDAREAGKKAVEAGEAKSLTIEG
ncbi:MAG TPA: hypothetical protein VLK65_04475 [Vicinamibacteria bacterium]|nr:hypothetical protein [Vicinamibacteria bacterium]